MKNSVQLIFAALVLTILIQFRQDLEQLRSVIKEQHQEIVTLQGRLTKNTIQATLAVTLGKQNQTALFDMRAKRVVKVTAYSPRVQETDSTPFITASNTKVRPGIVAVSRDLFDKGWVFGKKIYIKSLGVFTIEDLMAKRKNNQVDIFMPKTARALAFGRRNLEAFLLEPPHDAQSTYTELFVAPKDELVASELIGITKK
ncbi:MAG: 3D domain-containing protein [Desulfovibrionales bacterium]|nr:3D domain-containing protein [Desulfovibrionales bacterium]